MLRIRLQRKGRKKRPIFHLVVADSRNARDGRIIEQVGRYDNVTEKKEVVLNEDRILYWLDTGAQPSDTVRKILRNEGVLYKRHLMMWGKSEEEIEAALEEWRSYRESKEDKETSRKNKHKDVLAAEEKEFKNQVEKKAAKAAAELEAESSTEGDPAPEAPDTEEATAEAEEATTEETPEVEAKEAAEKVEENVAEVTEEPATEEAEATDDDSSEDEEEEAEAKADDAEQESEEEDTSEEAEAEVETDTAEEEAPAEEAAEATQTSSDMTAKEAIDHIKNTDLDALKGFIADDESRKTVMAAWEDKQSED